MNTVTISEGNKFYHRDGKLAGQMFHCTYTFTKSAPIYSNKCIDQINFVNGKWVLNTKPMGTVLHNYSEVVKWFKEVFAGEDIEVYIILSHFTVSNIKNTGITFQEFIDKHYKK